MLVAKKYELYASHAGLGSWLFYHFMLNLRFIEVETEFLRFVFPSYME